VNQVETAIEQRTREDKRELADQIRRKITEAGYEPEEILHLIKGRSRRIESRVYATWIDPENSQNTYVRGPLPGWLKKKMTDAGMDPADKEQRENFKQTHLKKVIGDI